MPGDANVLADSDFQEKITYKVGSKVTDAANNSLCYIHLMKLIWLPCTPEGKGGKNITNCRFFDDFLRDFLDVLMLICSAWS